MSELIKRIIDIIDHSNGSLTLKDRGYERFDMESEHVIRYYGPSHDKMNLNNDLNAIKADLKKSVEEYYQVSNG